ncbi:MAG: hypothetical protein OHK0040_05670 [bacterium]
MKRLIGFTVLFFLIFANVKAMAEIYDRIVAIVGEEPILLSQLRKELRVDNNERLVKIPREKQEKALDDLIEKSLIEQKAKKLALTVTDKEVEEEVENVKKNNNITTEVLVEVLKREGLTLEDYREAIRSQILKAKLINREVRSQVVVTDEILLTYYRTEIATEKETLVNFDVLTIYSDEKNELDEDIKDYYKLAKNKKSLEAVLKEIGSKYKANLNNPRNVKLSLLSKELKEAIKDMKKEEVGPLVRFKEGYQIFILLSQGYEGLKPFEEVKEELKKKFMKDKLEKAYSDWLSELKKEFYVEKRL